MGNTGDPTFLLVSRDLFFTSRITGTAAALGMRVETAGDAESAAAKLPAGGYRSVLIDLETPDLDPAAIVAALPTEDRPAVIAFGAHVHEALLESARAAGCDQVLPRSRFSATLPEILRGLN